jgi:hypothetical protein
MTVLQHDRVADPLEEKIVVLGNQIEVDRRNVGAELFQGFQKAARLLFHGIRPA